MINLRYSAIFLGFAVLSQGCAASPDAQAQTVPAAPATVTEQAPELSQKQRFDNWKVDFISRAIAKGYDREMVTSLIEDAEINELALDRDRSQPEFTKPVWSYVDNAASADRLNTGRAKLAEVNSIFDAVEARYNVPRHILTAIWGLETSYGRIMGNHEIISALSTFAFEGRRTRFGEQQLFALLDMVAAGDVRPEQLTGSWAGAMGMTQFIPTTFRDYAVDFDNDGNKDLWGNPEDALGSAAHYLARHGWRKAEPVMTEVSVPEGFDYSLLEGTKKTINNWTALGVAPITGQRWSAEAGFLEAKMIAPGGHRGPKILTFKNFDVIKKYNNSTSYAMGITVLGDALRGQATLRTPWPRDDKPLSFENKKALQTKLTALGYSTGGVDGQIGPNSRKAIRAWQRANGLPADGYMEQTLFQRLMQQ
jgi:membrane-bound lytic murein transglycosylase B